MGSSVETQTYRKGHAHHPMESTKPDLILRSASSRVSKDEWHERGRMVRDGAARLLTMRVSLLHPHHPLAAVLAGEQADQRFRRVLDAVDHVLLHFQFA